MNMLGDEPPYLSVGTEVSAKYKGAFCEAKVRKVDRIVKCKVTFKIGNGTYTVLDNQVKGVLRVGANVEAKHPDKKELAEATICKIQDCSQYTVVFDDGDITTLRRSALCLKSGRHFAESETLDQLPLTHPEHFGNPVVGGRRGRRRHLDDSSGDEEEVRRKGKPKEEKEADIGKVVCVELGDKKKMKDNWFPGLVVAPNAQDTVRIKVKEEYLVRSFSDGRYYTVPKKEAMEFTREIGLKVDNNTLKTAVEKAVYFLDKDELPPHWDRDLLFGLIDSDGNSDSDVALDSDSSDDEPREEKDHFVAQLYKFMDDRGSPINNCPSINQRDLDLYKLFKVVHKLNGYNRVSNRNQWKMVSTKLGLGTTPSVVTQVKHAYKKYLHNFEDFYRKLGCTMVNHPRNNRSKPRSGRSLLRDIDRSTPVSPKVAESSVAGVQRPETKSDDVIGEKDASMDSTASVRSREEDAIEAEASDDTTEDIKPTAEPTSTRKKFPSLKASPRTREKRKAEAVELIETPVEARKSKRPKVAREERENSVEVVDEPKDQQRSSTRSRSKEEQKTRKEMERRAKNAVKTGEEPVKKIATAPVKVAVKKKEDKEGETTDGGQGKGKAGRKRRNTECNGRPPTVVTDEVLNLPCVVAYKSIFIGDMLKVYYGAPGEPKGIYEAKVLDMEQDDQGETVYLVHYAGWNSRYDEWVKRSKIADNLSWTLARGKAHPPKAMANKTVLTKRRPPSVKGEPVGSGGRSTTPSSVTSSSSRTKSPATPSPTTAGRRHNTRQAGEQRTTRRTRKLSGHTDISIDSESDTESAGSGSDTEDKPSKYDRKGPLVEKDENTGKEDSQNKDGKKCETAKDKKASPKRRAVRKVVSKEDVEETRRSPKPKRLRKPKSEKEEENENEEKKKDEIEETVRRDVAEEAESKTKTEEEPKGRDFDLNQIRSELKGFDKAVKVKLECEADDKEPVILDDRTGIINLDPEGGGAAEAPADTASGQVAPEQLVPTSNESAAAPPADVKVEVAAPKEEEMDDGESGADAKEDIYEFKEPEPFEFTEVRRPLCPRIFDDVSQERSAEKRVKSPSVSPARSALTPEKKESSPFEVDVKSRFRKTIGKKMKDLSGVEKKEPVVSVEKVEKVDIQVKKMEIKESPAAIVPLPKLKSPEKEVLTESLQKLKPPEKEVSVLSLPKLRSPEKDMSVTVSKMRSPEKDMASASKLRSPEKDMSVSLFKLRSPEKDMSVSVSKLRSEKDISVSVSKLRSPEKDISMSVSKLRSPEKEVSVATLPMLKSPDKEVSAATLSKLISPEKEIPVLKVEADIWRCASPEVPVLLVPDAPDDMLGDTSLPNKVEDPPCLVPITTTIFTLGLNNDKDRARVEEEDPISAAIQRVIAQSSIDEDSDGLEMLSTAPVLFQPAPLLVREPTVPKTQCNLSYLSKLSRTDDKASKRVLCPVSKKLCTNRRSLGKRLTLSKDSSESGSDSDSAGERLVIVNEDSAGEPECEVPATRPEPAFSPVETKKRSPLAEVRMKRKSPLPMASVSASLPPPPASTTLLALSRPLSPGITHVSQDTLPVKVQYVSSIPSIPVISSLPSTSLSSLSSEPARKLCPASSSSPSSSSSSCSSGGKTEEEWRVIGTKEPEEGESNLKSLLCEETIPGSPAGQEPCKDEPGQSQSKPAHVADVSLLVHQIACKRRSADAAAVMDNTPPTTPESSLSTISGSPREDRVGSSSLDNESTKSHRDSSEVDLDNEHDQRLRKLGCKTRDSERRDSEGTESHPVKKKRRSRKRSESLSEMNKRLRGGRPSRGRSDKGADSDSDDQCVHTLTCDPSLINTRSPRPSKYNFFCELGPELDASQRISLLQQKLQDLRKTYMNVKSDLASIDRRRKKLRRREREEKAAALSKTQEVICP